MYIYTGKLKSIWSSAGGDLVVIFPSEIEVNQPVIVSWESLVIVNDNLDESRSSSGVISELEPQEFGFNISIDWGQDFRLIGLIATGKESLIIAMKDKNGGTLFTSTLTNLQEQEVSPVVSRLIKNTLQDVPNGIKSLGSTSTMLNSIWETSTILNDTDSTWFCELADSGDDTVMKTAVYGALSLGVTALGLIPGVKMVVTISLAAASTAITLISGADTLWSGKEPDNRKLPPGRTITRKGGFAKNNCVYLTRLIVLPKSSNRLVLQMYKKDGLTSKKYGIKDIIKEVQPQNMLDLKLDSVKEVVNYSYIEIDSFKIINKPHTKFNMRSNLINEDADVWFSYKPTGNLEDFTQGSKFKFDSWMTDIEFSYDIKYVSVATIYRKYYGVDERHSGILELPDNPSMQVLRLKSREVSVIDDNYKKKLGRASSQGEVLNVINNNKDYVVWSWEEGGYIYGYETLDKIGAQSGSSYTSYVYLKVSFEKPFTKVQSV
ncbi:hypothetical protein [Photorhabdus temperata]|uniref:Uncharacterized protein n=1 Tax=Photorhabdus temperata J3 TaxID=1389415 RepID=U7QTK3_PHOTE|nr:hypothetical protein [Photorhabdus temperata]ERT11203.1 hypothetical protein O185_20685 [Photorhabdus temperata J3]